jgi:hypothetical protein
VIVDGGSLTGLPAEEEQLKVLVPEYPVSAVAIVRETFEG